MGLSRDSERFLYPFFHKKWRPLFLSDFGASPSRVHDGRKGVSSPPKSAVFLSLCEIPWELDHGDDIAVMSFSAAGDEMKGEKAKVSIKKK